MIGKCSVYFLRFLLLIFFSSSGCELIFCWLSRLSEWVARSAHRLAKTVNTNVHLSTSKPSNERAIGCVCVCLCMSSGWKQRLVLCQPKIRGFKWKDNGSWSCSLPLSLYSHSHSHVANTMSTFPCFQLCDTHSPHHFWQLCLHVRHTLASQNGFVWLLWASSKWRWVCGIVYLCARCRWIRMCGDGSLSFTRKMNAQKEREKKTHPTKANISLCVRCECHIYT